jgi:rhodanese-related sulfurtransferase
MFETKIEPKNLLIRTVEPDHAFKLIKEEGSEFTIIDLRSSEEFKKGHIEGAENMDVYAPDFEERLDELDREKKYIIYCGTGVRGTRTMNKMEDMEFNEVYNILGGFKGWEVHELSVVE